jgi:hypothetical protein
MTTDHPPVDVKGVYFQDVELPKFDAFPRLFECGECGAVVIDRQLHAGWHKRQE